MEELKQILEYRPSTIDPRREQMLSGGNMHSIEQIPVPPILEDIKSYCPSECMKKAEAAIASSKHLLNDIMNEVSKDPKLTNKVKEHVEAIKNRDYAKIEAFDNQIASDIKGNTKLEMLTPLIMMNESLEKVMGVVSSNAYGKVISANSAAELDKDVISVMEHAVSVDDSIINYGAVYTDAFAGVGLTNYFQACDDFVTDLNDIIGQPSISGNLPDGVANFLNKNFTKEAEVNARDRAKLLSLDDSSMKERLVINMYTAKAELLKSEEMARSIGEVEDFDLRMSLFDQLNESISETLVQVMDFHRHAAMESMYRGDFTTTLRNKHTVRNLQG